MKKNKGFFIGVILSVMALWFGCQEPEKPVTLDSSELQHFLVGKLTDVIVHDILSPPVASRIYAYCNLAYYEVLRSDRHKAISLIGQMHGFGGLPSFDSTADHQLHFAASVAFMQVAEALVFSKDSIKAARTKLWQQFMPMDEQIRQRSETWGEIVAKVILERAANDNYLTTRGMPKLSVFPETGKWQQTPPEYADAMEPYWKLIRPLLMDSASQFSPPPPYPYDISPGSPFLAELKQVYEKSKSLTPTEDTIARFWDDNPFMVEHKGHLTYANKKITPVGHWMGITEILSRNYAKGNDLTIALAYALTSSAIFDGFISCWHEKYRSMVIRPITAIREQIEPEWDCILQTPPFPEYTSGHSVISAAAAQVLTAIFGEVPFHDTTELKYIGLERSFSSPLSAANESGLSRFYGGIHYMNAIVQGGRQGRNVGYLFAALIKE